MSSRRRVAAVAVAAVVLAGAAGCLRQPADTVTYVALGASDAVGVGATDRQREGWVPVLHGRMPEGTQLLNLGVSGSTLEEALEDQLPAAVDADPDITTVWLAVNDLRAGVPLDEYRRDLETLLDQLREATTGPVAVANIPDLTRVPGFSSGGVPPGAPVGVIREEIGRWNAAIEEVAAERRVYVVDLFAASQELAQHPEYVSADGTHPSTAGHRRLAEMFWDVIGDDVEAEI